MNFYFTLAKRESFGFDVSVGKKHSREKDILFASLLEGSGHICTQKSVCTELVMFIFVYSKINK